MRSTLASLGICIVLVVASEAAAQSLDRAKAAAAMIDNARKAYEAGQYERASDLFLAAFRSDPTQDYLLYNGARAAHLAGKLDKADELYRQLVEKKDVNPAVVAKTKTYRDELRWKRAEDKNDEAAAALKQGNQAAAARMFADAFAIAPDRTVYLFRAGQASLNAGAPAEAESRLRTYLEKAPADAEERRLARSALDRLAEERAKAAKPAATSASVPATPAPTAPIAVVAPAPASGSGIAGWALVGAGAAGVGLAAWAWTAAAGAQSAFDAGQVDVDKNGRYDMTHAEATRLSGRVGTFQTTAAVSGGLGVAALGAGAWLLFAGPATPVTVGPATGGVVVAGRF